MRVLLEAGVNGLAVDNSGITPLNVAALNGHMEVVKLLRPDPAEVEITEHYDEQWTARYETAWDQYQNVDSSILTMLPSTFKRQGKDWFAIFNRHVPKQLEFSLVSTCSVPGWGKSPVCFSANGNYFASVMAGSIRIFDITTEMEIASLFANDAVGVGSVCFNRDGSKLAAGYVNGAIDLWNIATKKIEKKFFGHTQTVCTLDVSEHWVVSGSVDGSVRVWSMKSGGNLKTFKPPTSASHVTAVALCPNGKYVAAGSLHGWVGVWTMQGAVVLKKSKGHEGRVNCVVFSATKNELISGATDKTVKVWKFSVSRKWFGGLFEIQSEETTFDKHKDRVTSVAASEDGKWIMSGGVDKSVIFWNAIDGKAHFILQVHEEKHPSPLYNRYLADL